MTKWLILLALAAAVFMPACKDSSDGGFSAAPPAEDGPSVSILAKGGMGHAAGNVGGVGGNVTVMNFDGTGIHILEAGEVDTLVEIPDVMPDLGENPRTIDEDTTLTLEPIYFEDFFGGPGGNVTVLGDDGTTPATGLWIKPGATLTVNPCIFDIATGLPFAEFMMVYFASYLHFPTGVYVEGELRAGRKIAQMMTFPGYIITQTDILVRSSTIFLDTTNLVVAPTGTIDLSGDDANQTSFLNNYGGSGGWFVVMAEGTIVNNGTIDASGGDGIIGGFAGRILLFSDGYGVYNGGTIAANGGTGTTLGGYGYRSWVTMDVLDYYEDEFSKPDAPSDVLAQPSPSIEKTSIVLASEYGVFNKGTLTSTGGHGPVGGGEGGTVMLLSGLGPGDYQVAVSAGTIDVSGGSSYYMDEQEVDNMDLPYYMDVDGDEIGHAGEIYILGNIYRVAGDLIARGGSSGLESPDDPDEGLGQPGGNIVIGPSYLIAPKPLAAPGGPTNPVGDSAVGANIDVGGGDGARGGWAGNVYIETDLDMGDPCAELYLVGYSLIDVSGGDGIDGDGGPAGEIFILNESGEPVDGEELHDGLLVNEADLVARGGIGYSDYFSGDGGNGGPVTLVNVSNFSNVALLNSGAIDTRGGDGFDEGGNDSSGSRRIYVTLYSDGDLTNSGDINTSGGYGYDDEGGRARRIYVTCEGRLENSGNLAANGGDSMYGNGGDADIPRPSGRRIRLVSYSDAVVNTGDVSADGGASEDDDGGDAGEILIQGATVSSSGMISARGGDGYDNDGSGYGGDGGFIEILSFMPPSDVDADDLSVDGGAAEDPGDGELGNIWIDGIHVVGDDPYPAP
jgi:hypothetical protein